MYISLRLMYQKQTTSEIKLVKTIHIHCIHFDNTFQKLRNKKEKPKIPHR